MVKRAKKSETGDNVFGGAHTETKLEALARYLESYCKVMQNQNFITWYLDPFCGSGTRIDPGEYREYRAGERVAYNLRKGAARIALSCNFDQYRFNDIDSDKLAQVQEYAASIGKSEKVRSINGDAADFIKTASERIPWKGGNRGVFFIDPFAMDLPWEALQPLSNTLADIWILFPLSALLRNLPRRRRISLGPKYTDRINMLLGTSDWQEKFFSDSGSQMVLWGEQESGITRHVDHQAISEYYNKRLGTIFPHVSKNYLLLKSATNSPMFSLHFALSNPSKQAWKTASRIANHILKM